MVVECKTCGKNPDTLKAFVAYFYLSRLKTPITKPSWRFERNWGEMIATYDRVVRENQKLLDKRD